MKRTFNIIFLTFGLCASTYAQFDIEAWVGPQVGYEITKDVQLSVQAQARFDSNISHIRKGLVNASAQWDVHRYFRMAFDYRLSSKPFNSLVNNWVLTNRLAINLEMTNIQKLINEKSRFDVSLRLCGTSEFQDQKRTDNYLRLRLKGEYNISNSKFTPNLSGEFFYHFYDDITYTFTEVRTHNRLNTIRIKGGVDYSITKNQKVGVYAIYQQDLGVNKSKLIFGLGYNLKIPRKSKKLK